MKKVMLGFLCGVVLMLAVGFATDKLNVKYVDYKVLVNGKETELKNQPLLKDGGTTYLPLRELAEVAGYKVGFNKDQGVISLNDTASTTSTVTPQPTSTPKPSSTPQAEAIVWKKLPQTWEQDGISITVHSIELQETLTIFNVSVANDSNYSKQLDFDFRLRGDYQVEGKKEKIYSNASAPMNFDNPKINVGDNVTGIIRKGRIDDGTENVTLQIGVDNGRYTATFHIDTTDLWK